MKDVYFKKGVKVVVSYTAATHSSVPVQQDLYYVATSYTVTWRIPLKCLRALEADTNVEMELRLLTDTKIERHFRLELRRVNTFPYRYIKRSTKSGKTKWVPEGSIPGTVTIVLHTSSPGDMYLELIRDAMQKTKAYFYAKLQDKG